MKKLIQSILKRFGFKLIRTNSKSVDGGSKSKTIKSKDLDYHETVTGNYYLPSHAYQDIIAQKIISNKVFDNEVVEAASKYIRPETTVLDVGSNFGQMAILFAKIVGNAGRVHAFEADEFIYSILSKNVKANNLESVVETHFGAVHDIAGEELIFPEQDFDRFGTYGAYGIDYNASEGRRVATLTIDSLEVQDEISFMKVDVQGGDLQAMKGAQETIKRNRMPILFEYEFHFEEEFGYTFQDYVDFVDEIGYRFHRVINGQNYIIIPKEHV